MKTVTPLKRSKELQPLSRDHHHALLLCWKIKTGFSKGVAAERIRNYAVWFYQQHLLPHFELEEKHIFPLLGSEHESVIRALSEHRQLEDLFKEPGVEASRLEEWSVLLEQHIRFEERVLFSEVQQIATPEQLSLISALHGEEHFEENLQDVFWE